jgi:malic enzyme
MIPVNDVNNILIFASIVLGIVGAVALILENLYLKARKRIKQLEKQLSIIANNTVNSDESANR